MYKALGNTSKAQADEYMYLGIQTQSMNYFNKALEINPKFSEVYYEIGKKYMHYYGYSVDYRKAAEELTKAINIDSTRWQYYEKRAACYRMFSERAKEQEDKIKAEELKKFNN